jgi:protein-tyrosine phosphatase
MNGTTRILMVCMGNVCRSPTAEVVLRQRVEQAGLSHRIEIDSAGTHASNSAAQPPDERSVAHAARRGYDLLSVRARRVTPADYQAFDLILAMDEDNLSNLKSICPPEHRHKLRLMMSYAPERAPRVIPDPYYGAAAGFEWVLDLIEAACDGLIAELGASLDLPDR